MTGPGLFRKAMLARVLSNPLPAGHPCLCCPAKVQSPKSPRPHRTVSLRIVSVDQSPNHKRHARRRILLPRRCTPCRDMSGQFRFGNPAVTLLIVVQDRSVHDGFDSDDPLEFVQGQSAVTIAVGFVEQLRPYSQVQANPWKSEDFPVRKFIAPGMRLAVC